MFNGNLSHLRVMIPLYKNVFYHDKSYTVYCIEVIYDGNINTLEKRYSEFFELYRKLQKHYGFKLPFPPKRVLNKDDKVLESRRKGLEVYLQALLNELQYDLPDILTKFLEIENIFDEDFDMEDGDLRDDGYQATAQQQHCINHHQKMICFEKDVFLQPPEKGFDGNDDGYLPDIILKGSLDAIYNEQ